MPELPDRLLDAIDDAVLEGDAQEWVVVTAHRLQQMLDEGRSMEAAIEELVADWSDIADRKEL